MCECGVSVLTALKSVCVCVIVKSCTAAISCRTTVQEETDAKGRNSEREWARCAGMALPEVRAAQHPNTQASSSAYLWLASLAGKQQTDTNTLFNIHKQSTHRLPGTANHTSTYNFLFFFLAVLFLPVFARRIAAPASLCVCVCVFAGNLFVFLPFHLFPDKLIALFSILPISENVTQTESRTVEAQIKLQRRLGGRWRGDSHIHRSLPHCRLSVLSYKRVP